MKDRASLSIAAANERAPLPAQLRALKADPVLEIDRPCIDVVNHLGPVSLGFAPHPPESTSLRVTSHDRVGDHWHAPPSCVYNNCVPFVDDPTITEIETKITALQFVCIMRPHHSVTVTKPPQNQFGHTSVNPATAIRTHGEGQRPP